MMDGPRQAKTFVAEYLAEDLPERILAYRNHWNVDSKLLPLPAMSLTYEPAAIDHWPTLITLVERTQNIEMDGFEQDRPYYRVTYRMRTYVWARGTGRENTTQVRDDMTTVVRDSLLDGSALRLSDQVGDCDPKIDKDSISEEYSDATALSGERFMMGAFLSYDLAINSSTASVDEDPLGTLYDVEIDVEPIPKTPLAPRYALAVAGNSEVRVSWKPVRWFGGIEGLGYRIEQSIDGGATWTLALANTESLNPFWVIGGLTNGTSYQFRVAGVNANGFGAMSPPSQVATPVA